MKSKLEAGKFTVLAEIETPKGTDVSGLVTNVTRIKGLVDGCIVPEMSSAVMSMSALGGAILLQGIGMPVVMQINCRDRNRLALQADLLAAYACGVRGIMAVTGESTQIGDHPQAKEVYDIRLPELLQALGTLQQGKDMAGIELKGVPDFLVGTTINPGVPDEDLEREIEDLNRKRDAGAAFLVTPPVFDPENLNRFLDKAGLEKTTILPTVLLLKSLGMARYIDRNIQHIHLPQVLITRIQKAPDKERECLKIAAETFQALKQAGFGGVVLSTMGWERKIPQIFEALRG
jgi:5,10-methylenetetrahydrofolate reductase